MSSQSPNYLQVLYSALLMFTTGSTFSLSVFTLPIQHRIPALASVWPSAMGFMYFVSAPIMILTGLFLDAGRRQKTTACKLPFLQDKTVRVRFLALMSALAFATLAIGGLGVRLRRATIIRNAVMIQGVPLGVGYLLAFELLAAWIPNRPGLAVGIGQLAFGFGSIVCAALFGYLLEKLDCVVAIFVSAALLAIVTAVAATGVRWPAKCEAVKERKEMGGEGNALLGERLRSLKMPWYRLCMEKSFWLYIAVIFATGGGYAFIPYFFKLGGLFGVEMGTLVRIYQGISLMAAVLGVAGSIMTDWLGVGRGYWWSGARNLWLALFAVQAVLFLLLVPLSNAQCWAGFVTVVAALIVMLASHAGCTALMARDLFGSANGCIVFGIGAGLAMGSGEGYATGIIAAVEGTWKGYGTRLPASYNLFYYIAAGWSLIGLACVAAVTRCEEAFEKTDGMEHNDVVGMV